MFFNADPKWLEEMAKREEECGGECLVSRRQEASSQDTPRSRGHETRPLMLVDRQGDSNSHEIASHVSQTCVSAIQPWRRIWCG